MVTWPNRKLVSFYDYTNLFASQLLPNKMNLAFCSCYSTAQLPEQWIISLQANNMYTDQSLYCTFHEIHFSDWCIIIPVLPMIDEGMNVMRSTHNYFITLEFNEFDVCVPYEKSCDILGHFTVVLFL